MYYIFKKPLNGCLCILLTNKDFKIFALKLPKKLFLSQLAGVISSGVFSNVSFTRPLSIYPFLLGNSIANLVFTSIKTILLGVTKSE